MHHNGKQTWAARAAAVAACAMAVMAAPGTAHAQLLKPTIGAGGGPNFAVGNTSNFVDNGYNILAFVGLDPGLIPIGARLDGAFNHFPQKGASGHDNLWSVTANGVFKIPAPIVQPYVIAGVGYYYSNVSTSSGSGNFALAASSSKFGINGGVGATLRIPMLFGIFAEARYHYVFNGSHAVQYIPITFGIQL